ncbi:hypothetical protein D092_14195 [Rhodococcus ruber Chol-4]|uniref:Uncharacterized protein n=1 Tax=Rhodococcus ruber TaxID=1830 RepID=A0A098BFI0_9NOCA|nr:MULTISPECIES: DUF485 domain-containing protein [Rhodococcus]RIK07728.1 MAG: DUF485 domain-containing protein [Acidobacteriota bacterium]AUM18867.1 DUF485 domain-containing protein [Rhodococcus ruber]AWH01260.1 DUF485 domain-containing protein [Rhodococcus ruber]AXY54599.1 hypothetical protein YT1_5210 [Rhodococcus ruber]KXF85494.1 hypothetical protein D092_14195 [Rhodococcus ruber Chol-4]
MTELRTQPTWSAMLALPEVVELRRRRRTVTNSLGGLAIVLFASFLVGFAYFPGFLGETELLGVPLSLWVVFSQFAGTWVLVYAYFRLTRTYIQPAADAAVAAVLENQERAA